MDNVDLGDAGIESPRLYRAAGTAATRMLLLANSISVLLPAYRRTLRQKYRGENVHFRSHGIWAPRPEFPDLTHGAIPSTASWYSANGGPISGWNCCWRPLTSAPAKCRRRA